MLSNKARGVSGTITAKTFRVRYSKAFLESGGAQISREQFMWDGWRLSPACCHCDTTPAKMHETDSLDRRTGRTPQWTIALANTQTNIARPNARLSTRHITYSRIRYHTNLNKTYTQILYTQQHYEYDGWHEEMTQSAGRVGMTAGVVLPSPLTQLSGNGQCEVAFWLSIFVVLFFRGFPPNYHTRR